MGRPNTGLFGPVSMLSDPVSIDGTAGVIDGTAGVIAGDTLIHRCTAMDPRSGPLKQGYLAHMAPIPLKQGVFGPK